MNNVTNNEFGIWLDSVSNNTILKNSFTYNERGVYLLDSWNNSLLKNNITDNNYGTVGIHIVESSNNNISRNVLSSNLRRFKGIELDDSSNNSLCENEIANNTYGIYLYISSNNSFFHNDFKNNTNQVYDDSWQNPSVLQSINVWDDGYPSGGNYWSDYSGTDANNDGIGDSPYVIDANNTDNYPLINPWSSPSIAVENLTSSKTVVGQGYDLTLNVTVKNLGNKIEGFNVVVYSNSTEIHTRYVLLKGNQSSLITLIWNTTGFSKGNYTISAYAWPVLGETDTDDNRFTGGVVTVTVAGDLDGNFAVQLNDLVTLAKAYGSKPGEPNWNPNADLDNNGVVGLPDLVALAKNYGKTDP
jgi:parallel beta-helix repeat protein